MGIFGNTFGLPHLIVIVLIVLLLFGATRLPALAKGLGQSMKIFKNEIRDDAKTEQAQQAATTASAEPTVTVRPAEPVRTADATKHDGTPTA